ncbi:MAG: hypothetical protein NVS1B13_24170 [Flavisolibacter sp.]
MNGKKVVIERLFGAPVIVWSIWTEPEFIKIWFGSDPKGSVVSATLELFVSGKYIICFKNSDGSEHIAFGEFSRIIKFSKLSYTWE